MIRVRFVALNHGTRFRVELLTPFAVLGEVIPEIDGKWRAIARAMPTDLACGGFPSRATAASFLASRNPSVARRLAA